VEDSRQEHSWFLDSPIFNLLALSSFLTFSLWVGVMNPITILIISIIGIGLISLFAYAFGISITVEQIYIALTLSILFSVFLLLYYLFKTKKIQLPQKKRKEDMMLAWEFAKNWWKEFKQEELVKEFGEGDMKWFGEWFFAFKVQREHDPANLLIIVGTKPWRIHRWKYLAKDEGLWDSFKPYTGLPSPHYKPEHEFLVVRKRKGIKAPIIVQRFGELKSPPKKEEGEEGGVE